MDYAEKELKRKILALYTEFNNVYGPYVRKSDGRKIVILYDGQKRSARQLAKVKLEVKLERRLTEKEEVDHIDGNALNDKYRNLRCVSSTKNRQLAVEKKYGKITNIKIKCGFCGGYLTVARRKYKEIKETKRFCSNSCKSRYFGSNQYGDRLSGYIAKR